MGNGGRIIDITHRFIEFAPVTLCIVFIMYWMQLMVCLYMCGGHTKSVCLLE